MQKLFEKYQQLVSYMNTGVNGMTHDMARLGFTQGQNAILFAELVEITNVKQENRSELGNDSNVPKPT